MTSRTLISLSLLALFLWQKAGAQALPAEDFFNGGAQLYISNNIPAALERVETGLKMYPEDAKLKKLEQLLKQQQQSQQNQQNQQEQDQQKQPDSKPKDQDQKKDSSPSKDQKPEPSKPDKNDGQKPQPAKDQKSGEQPQPASQGRPAAEMTPQEAKKLLDAQKDDEPLLVPAPSQGKPKDPNRPVRDW